MERTKNTVSGLASLTPDEVRLVRKLREGGASQTEIAKQLKNKVSQPSISNLLAGKTYREVE